MARIPLTWYPVPGTIPTFQILTEDYVCGFSALGARYSAPGHGKDERRGRYDLAACFVQAEGRTPNPVPGTRHREPGTE
jgi:hypothetical protein